MRGIVTIHFKCIHVFKKYDNLILKRLDYRLSLWYNNGEYSFKNHTEAKDEQ